MNEPDASESNGSEEQRKIAQDGFSSGEPTSIWTVVVIFIVLALSFAFPVIIFFSNAP